MSIDSSLRDPSAPVRPNRFRFPALAVAIGAFVTLMAVSPAQADHNGPGSCAPTTASCGTDYGYSIGYGRQGNHRRNYKRGYRYDNDCNLSYAEREYRRGHADGHIAGEGEGYKDGKYGYRYNDRPYRCGGSYHYSRGYRAGFKHGYRQAYDQGRYDRLYGWRDCR